MLYIHPFMIFPEQGTQSDVHIPHDSHTDVTNHVTPESHIETETIQTHTDEFNGNEHFSDAMDDLHDDPPTDIDQTPITPRST